VEPVIAEFVPDIEGNKYETYYADSQTGQGDQRIPLLPFYVPDGTFEIVL
jgi:hypothetical protein